MNDPKIAVGVCSASTKAAVTKVLDVTLGEERRNKLDVCILGDDVSKLKPDPLIYVTAAERLQIDPSKCVVVEDSMVGLRAAKGAVRLLLLLFCCFVSFFWVTILFTFIHFVFVFMVYIKYV